MFLGNVQHTNPVLAGGSYSGSGTFTLPQTITPGDYYFIVVADGGSVVYETNETNNARTSSTTVAITAGPVADLAVSNVTVPATAIAGTKLPVGWTVTNNGAATGNVPIVDAVYLSFDQVFDPVDVYLGSVTTPGGLAAGGSYTQNINLSLPAGVAGTYYVLVVTDSGQTVFESNAADDVNFGPQPMQIDLPAPADLVAGTITVPPTAVAGQTIPVTYQVSNQGSRPGPWVVDRCAVPVADADLERQRSAAGRSGSNAKPEPGRQLHGLADDPGARRGPGVVLPDRAQQHPEHLPGTDARQQPRAPRRARSPSTRPP